MAGPGDESAAAAGRVRGDFRASHADRERTIEALKDAFAQGRLTKDELDARAGQVLASRTYADLAAVTADIPAGPAAAGPVPAGPPGTPARTLAKAARRAGLCILVAFAVVGFVALTNALVLVLPGLICAVAAIIAASGFLGYGAVDAWQERRSRGQLPPRAGRDGRGLKGRGLKGRGTEGGELEGGRADQTRTDMRTNRRRPGRPRYARRGALVPRAMRPVPGAG